jgi:hypothetical protein
LGRAGFELRPAPSDILRDDPWAIEAVLPAR